MVALAAGTRRTPRSFGVAAVVCTLALPCSPALGAPWVVAPPAERPADASRAEALLAQADEARTQERWAEAARLFTDAYDALTVALLPELGEMTVRFAVESHLRDAEARGDDAPLRAARDLVARFEGELGALPEPRPLPDSVARMRDDLEAELRPRPAPAPGEWQAPPPTPPPPDATRTPPPPSATLSWVLVGSGSAAIVAGIATLVWGSRILPIAQRRLTARGPDPDPLRDEAYLDENRRRGRLTMGFGGAIAVIGVPLLVWGIVRLTGTRRRSSGSAATTARWAPRVPWADPSGQGWASR
jgi:hypothetical protein